MTALLATKETDLELPSGKFQLIRLFAISETEREYVSTHGAEALVEMLRTGTTYPVNEITRRSVV